MRELLISLGLLFAMLNASAQGIIRGKVSDENGETLIGVSIALKSNPGVGTVTDIDGNFSFPINDSLPHTIVITYVGFATIEETIHLKKGEVLVRNFTMRTSQHNIREVEVTAKATKSQTSYVEKIKKNAAVTIDYVSSESMKKSGDASVVNAVARIPGISTTGDFYTVRGIGDRYVKTAINGLVIPTLDPFTSNIKLDMFPSSMIDNVIVTKTASPDLPGDWSGAYMSINTKDYPEALSVNVETAIGYNSQSTFKSVATAERSSTDWLGYDNGFREHPHDNYVEAIIRPTQYQEFASLGLASYYNNMGVNNDNWKEGTTTGELYYKLGLVQMGYLLPALINDANAVEQAKIDYAAGPNKAIAFSTLNSELPAYGKSFPSNWNTTTRTAPLDFSQSFTIGNQVNLFKNPFGYLVGFRYATSQQFDPEASENRMRFDGSLSSTMSEQLSKESNGWTGLVNLAYKPSPNNSFSFLFMPNIMGVNKVRRSVDMQEPAQHVWTNSQYYESRQQLVYQFNTENYIPSKKIKIALNASYTDGQSDAPDFKNLQYYQDPLSNTFQIGGTIGDGIHRYYRYLDENLFDSYLTAELPIKSVPGFDKKLKFGGGYQYNDRKSDQYDYAMSFGPNSIMVLKNHDINSFLNPAIFDIHPYVDASGNTQNTVDAYYTFSNSPADHTFGHSQIISAFGMADLSYYKIRFSGGLRVEKAEILTDVTEFDSLNYPVNDIRRNYSNGYPIANPGKIDNTVLLPSVNIVYKLSSEEESPVNVRVNYSKTIARPSIRELSDVTTFDYELRKFVFGNSSLVPVSIDNYDARFEYYKPKSNFSVSVFDKEFKDHIELVESSGFTWQNVDKSRVYGIELEGKTALSNSFDIASNVTLINSETKFVRTRMEFDGGIKVYIPLDTVERAMFGQAPYVLNLIGTFHRDSIGFIATVSYNVQGPRLVIASAVPEIPDVYEMPRHLIDVKISKKFGRHFIVSGSVRDILNSSVAREYKDTDVIYSTYRYGTMYGLSVTYKL